LRNLKINFIILVGFFEILRRIKTLDEKIEQLGDGIGGVVILYLIIMKTYPLY
jgi:hypothetical protein